MEEAVQTLALRFSPGQEIFFSIYFDFIFPWIFTFVLHFFWLFPTQTVAHYAIPNYALFFSEVIEIPHDSIPALDSHVAFPGISPKLQVFKIKKSH